MRYTRLRRQIEGGTLVGTHGTTFSGGFDKPPTSLGKRKSSEGEETICKRQVRRVNKMKIKNEHDENSDEFGTDLSEYVDSEDEMPLAKRKAGRFLIANPQSFMSSSSALITNTSSKTRNEEIPMVRFQPMICPEPNDHRSEQR